MKREILSRTLVESVVDQGIRAIREDPERSVRKLVDLGGELAEGSFQMGFFRLAQEMLENAESPYYELIERAVNTIDNKKLKTFGINFGWNCLTAGSEQIRKREEAEGHNIPWSMTLHMGGGARDMSLGEYTRLISEGRKLGIYAYFLFPDESQAAFDTAVELVGSATDCVFFLFLQKNRDASADLPRLSVPSNLMLCVDSGGEHWQGDAALLRESGCLYALYRFYDNGEDALEITSGEWAKKIMPHAGGISVCVAGGRCPPPDAEGVHQYIVDSRLGQWYPTLIADYYADNLYTDLCISQGSCFLGVLPDGAATEYRVGVELPTAVSVRDTPLCDILKRYPK